MYWFETTLTFVLAIAIMVSVDWRLAAFAVMPAPAVSFAVVLFRTPHPRSLRQTAGDVRRYFEPRPGEPLGGAHGARVRAGAGRDAAVRGVERQYIARSLKLVRVQGLFEPLLEALSG